MQKFINGGIYQVNLNGKTSSEFNGVHPALIIRTPCEKELYYIIPLTTYSKERWAKDKEKFACRVKSTGSIALIDKMQVRHNQFIKQKSISENFDPPMLLLPTVNEISDITKKLCAYILKSTKDMNTAYSKYYSEINNFRCIWSQYIKALLKNEPVESDLFSYNKDIELNVVTITFVASGKLSTLSIPDMLYFIPFYVPYKCTANFQQDTQAFTIKVHLGIDK